MLHGFKELNRPIDQMSIYLYCQFSAGQFVQPGLSGSGRQVGWIHGRIAGDKNQSRGALSVADDSCFIGLSSREDGSGGWSKGELTLGFRLFLQEPLGAI